MNAHTGPGLRKCQPSPSALLIAALRFAMSETEASLADTAKWCGVNPATIKRWLRGEHPVAIERVMLSRRLWPAFWSSLADAHMAIRFAEKAQAE